MGGISQRNKKKFVGGSPHTNKRSEKGKFSEGANSKAFGRAQDEKSFKADSSTVAPLKRLEMETVNQQTQPKNSRWPDHPTDTGPLKTRKVFEFSQSVFIV